jgi:tetratricopeptide (TPR) repeat protein
MTRFTISLIGSMCIFAVGLSAQSPVGPQTGDSLIQQNVAQPNTQVWRMFLTGKVALSDGTPPPAPVLVKQTCGGRLRREVQTNSSGQFTFKMDANGGIGTGASQDASAAGHNPTEGMGRGDSYADAPEQSSRGGLGGCELEAVLSGFTARPMILDANSLAGASNVGTIVLRPLSKESGYTVSATTLQAPSKALKSYEKGLEALKNQKWEEAEREFSKATEVYPAFAVAWFELGVARSDAVDNTGAEDAWKHSLQADPKYVKPYQPLIALANMKHDWALSEHLASQWIATDPDAFPEAYLVDALAWLMMNDPDKAEHAARESIRLDKLSQVSKSRYVLGYILAQKHRYPESAQYFREYLAMAPNAENAATVRQQLAQYEQAGIVPAKQP